MVVNVSPWSVKGVDPEAREAAKIAARRSGQTLGAWLTQTIRNAATEQLTSFEQNDPSKKTKVQGQYSTNQQYTARQKYGLGRPHSHEQQYQSANQLNQQYSQTGYAKRQSTPNHGVQHSMEMNQTTQAYGGHQPTPTIQVLIESINDLCDRVDEAERKNARAVGPLADQVGQLFSRVKEFQGINSMSASPVEQSIIHIMERLDKMERDASKPKKTVHPRWWRKNKI